MEDYKKKLMERMEIGMKDGEKDFEQQYDKIMRKLKELQKARAQTAKENRLAESCQQRTEDLERYVRKTSWLQREFDEELVRRLIREIRVVNENKLEIQDVYKRQTEMAVVISQEQNEIQTFQKWGLDIKVHR